MESTASAEMSSRSKSFAEAVSLDVSRQRGLNNLDILPGSDRIWRVNDDLVAWLEAGDNFDLVAGVASGSYGSEHDLAIFHDADS